MASRAVNFSISTFNLCNLQSPGITLFGEFAWSRTQYQRKVGWLAAQCQSTPATVMAFQEVWCEHALTDVFHTAGLQDQYRLICSSAQTGMQVACAVHHEWQLLEQQWLTDFPAGLDWCSNDTRYALALSIAGFSRPILKLRLRGPDERTLTVFNVHLKSRRPIPPGNEHYYGAGPDHWLDVARALAGTRRLAEAAALRLLVNHQLTHSTDAVIVVGDCNDRYPGPVIDVLKGDARFRRGTNNRSGRRADWGLYHLLELNAQRHTTSHTDYVTFCGDDELLALDHLLFSWHFHPRAAGSRWQLQAWQVHNRHLSHYKPFMSGHAMVWAQFRTTGERI